MNNKWDPDFIEAGIPQLLELISWVCCDLREQVFFWGAGDGERVCSFTVAVASPKGAVASTHFLNTQVFMASLCPVTFLSVLGPFQPMNSGIWVQISSVILHFPEPFFFSYETFFFSLLPAHSLPFIC